MIRRFTKEDRAKGVTSGDIIEGRIDLGAPTMMEELDPDGPGQRSARPSATDSVKEK